MVKTKSDTLLSLKLRYIVIYDLMTCYSRGWWCSCHFTKFLLWHTVIRVFHVTNTQSSFPPAKLRWTETCFYLLNLLVSQRKKVCLDVALNMSSGQTGWQQSQVPVCRQCLFPSVSLLHRRKLSDTDISEFWCSGSHRTVPSIFCQTWSHEKKGIGEKRVSQFKYRGFLSQSCLFLTLK